MNFDKVKKKIILLICCVSLIIAAFIGVIIYLNSTKTENALKLEEESDRVESEEGKIQEVNSFKSFYNIEKSAKVYIDSVKEEQKEKVYKLLNEKYIKDNGINGNNVLNKVDSIDANETLYINKMYQQTFSGETTQYIYIDGLLRKTDNNILYEKSIYLTVIINQDDATFSIIPGKQQFPSDIEDINEVDRKINIAILQNVNDIDLQENVVEDNTDEEDTTMQRTGGKAEGYEDSNDFDTENINSYIEQDINDDFIVRSYFMDYITNLKYYGKDMYQQLDQEYREKRFGSIEEFENYINSISKNIDRFSLTSYKIDKNDDNTTKYTCMDKYGNYYVFNAKAVMDYTIELDTYTIKSDEEINDYIQKSDKEKVTENVKQFIQMLNSKDYNHLYDLLDQTFRNNNFDNVGKFKDYINNNLFEYNKGESGEISEDEKYYKVELTLSDPTLSNKENKNMTIIMKLEEGTDFVMSFSIK